MDKNITPQDVLDLILAFKDADESYREVMEQQHVKSLSFAAAEMAKVFGKFLTGLDLLEPFARLGKYVRNFGDAKAVLIQLSVLVNDRLEIEQPEETKVQMERLVQICHEVGRISAAFSPDQYLHYPDDFTPGNPLFSEN
ncbi:hypothetical protein MTO98_25880 [Mucilaginibacter sp. SMC90]|uniref:hypothetical protein n=1 Tax=Mucilaginibacter sp. SMC90 TaxID=2929803 RepID=UPI001FB32052|nr:hypothetical protein [Mucilaginibacter sp. SMC90]UOE47844.1 hypothetical protein MTO98_25880 [Mucilaginibacter sp. SMC90]